MQPRLHGSTSTAVHVSDTKEDDLTKSEETSLYDGRNPLALAPREEPASAGDSLLRFFRLRKQRERIDPDAIATQESVFDGPHAAEYQPIPEWENIRLFDPKFRWTHREEARVRRKCDFWVFAWVVVMFFALDIDRCVPTPASFANYILTSRLRFSQLQHRCRHCAYCSASSSP